MSTATKTAPKGSSRFKSYDQLIPHTDRPLASRRELAIGRNGAKVTPRKFHLNDDEVEALKADYKETKVIPNPHNKGFYHYLFAALAEHPNEQVPQSRVMKAVERLMSDESTIEGEGRDKTTAWDRWVNKDPRNKETGKDWEGRFEQNVTVLQRLTGLTPYGRRIFDLHKVIGGKGVVIDVLVGASGAKFLKLNLNSERPVNEAKVRGMGSPAALAAEKAEKRSSRKAAKPKTKARKAKAPVAEVKADQTDEAVAKAELAEATA